MFGTSVISWCSKAEKTVALHTCEAEYVALSMLVQEIIHLRSMVKELKMSKPNPTTVFTDNMSALKLSKNDEFHARCKHIDVVHHFLRQRQTNKEIAVEKVASEENVSDVFTKPLPRPRFEQSNSASELGLLLQQAAHLFRCLFTALLEVVQKLIHLSCRQVRHAHDAWCRHLLPLLASLTLVAACNTRTPVCVSLLITGAHQVGHLERDVHAVMKLHEGYLSEM